MSKIHDNPFRPDYDNGAPEPSELDRLRALNAELLGALQDMALCYDQGPDSEEWLRGKTEAFIDPLDSTSEEEERAVMLVKERTLDKARAAIAKAGAK